MKRQSPPLVLLTLSALMTGMHFNALFTTDHNAVNALSTLFWSVMMAIHIVRADRAFAAKHELETDNIGKLEKIGDEIH